MAAIKSHRRHEATLTLLYNEDLRTSEHLPIGKVTITVEYNAPKMPTDWAQSLVEDQLASVIDTVHDHILNDWEPPFCNVAVKASETKR